MGLPLEYSHAIGDVIAWEMGWTNVDIVPTSVKKDQLAFNISFDFKNNQHVIVKGKYSSSENDSCVCLSRPLRALILKK